ncbi:MAG: ImuA family protein [Chitinophagaceae bacterium]
MHQEKENIIARLKKDILPLQGFKPALTGAPLDLGFGSISDAFPNSEFPLGVVHEFLCSAAEGKAATSGFIAGLLSPLMRNRGVSVWISSSRTVFPPALKTFGIAPDKIIFVDLHKEKDVLWAMEEALKCDGLSAVVGEMQELSFTASRRLQLIVEQSRVTGFILRINSRNTNTTACVTRWKISSIASRLPNDLPGVGFPLWNAELLKVRNGKPGSWQIEWSDGVFRPVYKSASMIIEQQKKTG